MVKRVIIIGGGISGLVVANVFSKYASHVAVEVYESGVVGGEFVLGGLKYIHQSRAMEDFLDGLGIYWCDYRVRGGILLRGEVRKYPLFLSQLSKDEAIRIQRDHYRKTRLMELGDFDDTAMNEPANAKSNNALNCDFQRLVDVLASNCNIIKASLIRVINDKVYLSNNTVRQFDYLVLTIPLWIIKLVTDYEIASAIAMKLNIAIVKGTRNTYAGWDYVYTPYTPSNYIHRISYGDGGYAVEANGKLDEVRLYSDLNFLFKNGWRLEGIKKNLKGHLLPLDQKIIVPSNVALLGRFAAWESRMTVDVTLNRAIELGKRWFE
jgi:hypothetical protein